MKIELDILHAMKKTIEAGWNQGSLASDVYGVGTNWRSAKATCYCLYGAYIKAATELSPTFLYNPDYDGHFAKIFVPVHDDARARVGMYDSWLSGDDALIEWNDEPGRTQAEVVTLIDNAIEHWSK